MLHSWWRATLPLPLLRLAKLLRILRAGRMFQRWESRLAIDYSVLSLSKPISPSHSDASPSPFD